MVTFHVAKLFTLFYCHNWSNSVLPPIVFFSGGSVSWILLTIEFQVTIASMTMCSAESTPDPANGAGGGSITKTPDTTNRNPNRRVSIPIFCNPTFRNDLLRNLVEISNTASWEVQNGYGESHIMTWSPTTAYWGNTKASRAEILVENWWRDTIPPITTGLVDAIKRITVSFRVPISIQFSQWRKG